MPGSTAALWRRGKVGQEREVGIRKGNPTHTPSRPFHQTLTGVYLLNNLIPTQFRAWDNVFKSCFVQYLDIFQIYL